MSSYFNPYSGVDFFGFFSVLFHRLVALCTGHLSFNDIVSDELQILVLVGMASSAAVVGSFLVLRKMTMLANALSHTILLGIVSAYLLMLLFSDLSDPSEAMNVPILILASLITGVVTTFLTNFLTKKIQLQEDASIGLVFTFLFALGIVMITLFTRNVHLGTELVMGNVDALKREDLKNIYFVLALNVCVFTLFFKEFKLTTFDPSLASALGFSPQFYTYLLMLLTSLTSVGAFKAVGVLMVLAFFVIPPLIARLLTSSLSTLIILAVFFGILSSLLGVALSRHLLSSLQIGLSTGGIVVCMLFLFFILCMIFAPQKGLIAYFLNRKMLRKKSLEDKDSFSLPIMTKE